MPCHILHAEDSPDDAELVRLALERSGLDFSVHRVDTEPDFVAQLETRKPDVILCDYDMPRFSAERALQVLQERSLDVPFIVISNHIDENAAVIAMQGGASDYLPKRTLGRLPKAIAAAIDRAAARAESHKAAEALKASEAMKRAILESLQSCIAVVDSDGTILAVNRAWEEFQDVKAETGIPRARVGDNYLHLLQELAAQGTAAARRSIETIHTVTSGERAYASLDYQFNVGSSTRWFLMRIVRMEGSAHVVISHQDITDQMMAHVALEDAHRRLQVLSKRVLSVQEEERRSISRELHDDVGQTLAAMKIGLHRMSTATTEQSAELLAECLLAAETSLEKLRNLASRLRPPQLDQLGLPDALAWLAGSLERASGMSVSFECQGLAERRARPALESASYRIAQEAMNNALRHANCTRIRVAVESDGRLLKMSVHDDGSGFDAEAARTRAIQAGSLGIIGMEERAQLAGGRLRIRSVGGSGTTVTAIFPMEESRSAPAELHTQSA
jgi:signal transduction histidine kinase/DNA-binding NarL/FixJ family response regulator